MNSGSAINRDEIELLLSCEFSCIEEMGRICFFGTADVYTCRETRLVYRILMKHE